MTPTVVFLSGLAAYLGGGSACIVAMCRRVDTAFVRDMHRLLRSRAGVGSEEAGSARPRPLPVTAGVERGGHPHSAAAPPATQPLAGVALTPSSAAPARPPRRTVHL